MAILLDPRFWIRAVVALAILGACFFCYRAGKASKGAEFDAYKLAQAEQRTLADRAREHRNAARQADVDKEARDGQQKFSALEAQRDAARADGERMRSLYLAAAERARKLSSTVPSGPGQSDPDPIGVFAGLLERADRRAEAVGGYAQKLRIAGTVCERSFDALREQGSSASPSLSIR